MALREVRTQVSKSKSSATNGVVAIVAEVVKSPRVNPLLIGILIGVLVTAVILFGTVVWILK